MPTPDSNRVHAAGRIVAMIAALSTTGAIAQRTPLPTMSNPAPMTIPGSQVRDFRSAITKADYRLTVLLPAGYDARKRYPTLYVLDGNKQALIAYVARMRLTLVGHDIPDIIIIGVDYPGATGRGVDYAMVGKAQWEVPHERGVANFMRVMRDEIIPLVERDYSADPADRGIGGHSLGGLAATYALFHDADLFKRFWLSSPSLIWNHDAAMRFPADYARTHSDLDARVFSDVGEIEAAEMGGLLGRLRTETLSRGFKHVTWQTAVARGQTHATTPIVEMPDAMLFLYGRPDVSVPSARLAALAGRYRRSDGTIATLTTDGTRLYLSGMDIDFPSSEPDRVRMNAQSQDHFYVNFIGYEAMFPAGEAHPDRVTLSTVDDAKDGFVPKTVVAYRVGDDAR